MAGRIPQEFLDQLLGRVDLVEIVNARVPLRRAGREFVACCPFHAEKTPSFSVSPRKQFYHCFGCGVHGNAIGFLMAYERLEFPDAVEELARLAGLDLPQTPAGQSAAFSKPSLEWIARADHFFRQQLREHPLRQRAVDYLRQRGLTGQIANAFGIGYAPPGWENLGKALCEAGATAEDLVAAGLIGRDEQGRPRDRFRDRIIFPIRDRRGRVIAFGGRALDGDTAPKYLNSPETPLFHKGSELYGLYEARTHNQQLRRLLVVEGYMDVVALAQHDISYAVATLGTATTTEHVERLFRAVNDLIFCFDGDRAGRAAAWRALDATLPFLRDGRQVGFLFLPEGEDPDTLVRGEGRTAFEQRLEQVTPLAEYLFAELRAQADPNTLAGRARLAELARPLLEKLPDGHFRDLMEERLRHEAQLLSTRLRPPPSTATNPADRNLRLTRTPLRKAIALLLYKPELAQEVSESQLVFREEGKLGVKLLADMIAILRTNPNLTTAALLERYRGTPEGAILEQLAAWQLEVPEQNYQFEREFDDILGSLGYRDNLREHLPEMLLQRGSPRALSAEEREAVWNLGKAKKV
ncbi:MAG TPA: DNA primase [Candidatus Competibacter sp.]|nr:DNA primase [Candidatus Competibacter sp.]